MIRILLIGFAVGGWASAMPIMNAAETVEISSEPIKIKPGDPLSNRAMVQKPPLIRGALSWSLETRRHRGAIFHVSLSPDGKTLATGGIDGTIRLWDVETGKFIKCLLGHNSYIYRLAWSPDGRTLASAGAYDSRVGLWDVQSGLLLRAVPSPKGYVTHVTWASDGKRIAYASANSGYVFVYDVVKNEVFNKDKDVALGVPVTSLEFSPDGQHVGFLSTQTPVSLWELSAVKSDKSLETTGDVSYALAWSVDGKLVAVAGAKGIRVYDFATAAVKQTIEAPATSVAYSPDGKMLASAASGGAVQLWEVESGKAIKTLTGSATTSLSWSADSKLLATTTTTTAVVWDVESATVKQLFDCCGIYPPVWSPGKPFINGNYTAKPTVFDPATGKKLCQLEHQGIVIAFAWSRDGKTLATGSTDKSVRLWEMPSGAQLAKFDGHTAAVHAVAWMPDSKSVASGGADHSIRIWRVPEKKSTGAKKSADKSAAEPAAGESKTAADKADKKETLSKKEREAAEPLIAELKRHTGPVTQLAFPNAAKLLASGSNDKSLKIWNLTTNKLITTIDIGAPALALSWSPDGKVLGSSGVDERLNFWNPTTGKIIKYWENQGSPPTVSAITWSPNGLIIAAGRRNHTMQLWDANAGKVVHNLTAMAPVMTATWTPSGATVTAGCEDRTVRFWDAASGQLRGHLIAEENQVAAVSTDGHYKGEPGIEAELFYVAQTERAQETFTLSEFATKAKWKNNPAGAAAIGK